MQPQRITITIQFSTYQNPGDEGHIEQVLQNYFKAKGVNYSNKTIYV